MKSKKSIESIRSRTTDNLQNPPTYSFHSQPETRLPAATANKWPKGEGEMAQRIREFDWSKTPIGPVENWSHALRMVVDLMLANRFPMILWWGPQFHQLYNDPYRPIPVSKHPRAMGQPASECWSEIWQVIGPLIETPFRGGPATWMEDILLEINRKGFTEETHFTIAYSPVPDETAAGGIGGVLATVHEISGKVVGDRRVTVLRDLGARSTEGKTAAEACAIAAKTLEQHAKEIPFALLYLISPNRTRAELAAACGVTEGSAASPPVISLAEAETDCSPWPFAEVMRSESAKTVTNLAERLGPERPAGPWADPPHTAMVVPIHSNKAHHLAGFLVAGISSRLEVDDHYRSFLDLVATQLATAIANARDYEEERKRAAALAEIDRAKTAFFSNVSHEFRTPLTLMLGPVDDLLTRSHIDLSPAAKAQLEVVNRNGRRLQRLVNTLLDFSRIEAGRVQAVFEPTDIAEFTADLASVFRAATEKAGLCLTVDCPPLQEPVYVDRDLWEKIVLNLVSNALKFTFEGGIEVKLRSESSGAVLTVRDTGVGIPPEEMPRIFERFHRVKNMRSRTHEGSGIGLALVHELVKLHGGFIRAESLLGEGTTIIVTLPLGKEHLPADCLGATRTLVSTAIGAAPFLEEALRWLPETTAMEEAIQPDFGDGLMPSCSPGEGQIRHRIIIADDNADMRQYLARLMSERYSIESVADGQAALAAARKHRPDLILSDAMMPNLDGFGLVREVRADEALKTIPVILLSARAGEESRVEGLQHGADDYLIKPFSARELLARVAAHLEMARMRKESAQRIERSEARLRLALDSARLGTFDYNPLTDHLEWDEELKRIWGLQPGEKEEYAQTLERIHPEDRERVKDVIAASLEPNANGNYECEYRIVWPDGSIRWTIGMGRVYFQGQGEQRQAVRMIGIQRDITEHKRIEAELRRSEARYRLLHESLRDGFVQVTMDGRIVDCNETYCQMLGYSVEELRLLTTTEITPERSHAIEAAIVRDQILPRGYSEIYEKEYRRKNGTVFPVEFRKLLIRDDAGQPTGMWAIVRDITVRKHAEETLRQSEERLQQALLVSRSFTFDWKPDTDQVFRSASCAAILGLSGDEVLHDTGRRFFQMVHPEDRPGFVQVLRDLTPVANTYAIDYRFVRSDGTIVVLEEVGQAIFDAAGKMARTVGVATDVTKRKQVEEQLRALNEELERRVEDRTRELQESQRQILHAEKLSAIGRLSASIAHEFNNPLQGVMTILKGFQKTLVLEEHDRVFLDLAFSENERMKNLIRSLQDFNRPSSGKKIFMDVHATIDSLILLSKSDLQRKGISIILNYDKTLPQISAIPDQIKQVILNLLQNAADACQGRNGVITIRTFQEDNSIAVAIQDNGIGIAPDKLTQIFQPFYTTKPEVKGTGLGLSICHGIVQNHQGEIRVESEPDKGSTFTVLLPIVGENT